MQTFSEIGEVPWPTLTQILQSMPLKWSVAIHRGPDIRFVFSENCYLLLEEETHLAVHDGHTEKHVLKFNLSKIVIPGLLQEQLQL